MRRLLCFAAFVVSCGPPAQVNCPDLASAGKCDMGTAEWCDANTGSGPPMMFDCTAVNGTCATTDSLGAWCAVPMGAPCTVQNQSRSGYLYCGDATGPTNGVACDLDHGCVTSSATCTPGDAFPVCASNTLVVDCTPWGQSVQRDCMALGATGCSDGACTGVPTDGGCDPTLLCEPGLICANGTCSFTPGSHPPVAQVVTFGGPVLLHPKVLPISWSSDPQSAVIDGFVQELTTTSYWGITTSEYQVGALTVQPAAHLPDPIPATYSDSQVISLITANTNGAGAPWGAADTSTIYIITIPKGVPFDDGTGDKCCTDYDGYHSEAHLNGVRVPYAIVCTCPGFDGPSETDAQQLTVAISHELVEAATDPYIQSRPAFGQTDDAHAVWTVLTSGEVADMCELNADADLIPADGTYMVQRTWSNAAAKAGSNPCVPATEPYSGIEPVLPDMGNINYGGNWLTEVVKIPVGMTGSVDLPLFSSGPTVPWTVQVFDYSADYNGGPRRLQVSLNANKGNNGDVIHLTIKPNSFDTTLGNAAVFVVESHFNNNKSVSLAFGVVRPN